MRGHKLCYGLLVVVLLAATPWGLVQIGAAQTGPVTLETPVNTSRVSPAGQTPSGPQEGMAIGLIPVGIQITPAHEQPAALSFLMRFRQREGTDQPAHPIRRMTSKPLRGIGLQLSQLRKHVVEINKERALHGLDASL